MDLFETLKPISKIKRLQELSLEFESPSSCSQLIKCVYSIVFNLKKIRTVIINIKTGESNDVKIEKQKKIMDVELNLRELVLISDDEQILLEMLTGTYASIQG